MDLQLNAKHALVFGGSRGIGLAIVEALIAEGARVSFCARNPDEVALTVRRLQAQGADVHGAAVDFSDRAATADWISARAEAGGVDVAILCVSSLALGATDEDWHKAITTDINGAVGAIHALRPHLAHSASRHGDAAIVQISTTAVCETVVTAAYGPAKAAIAHYCKALARELGAQKVRINTVSPGMVYFEGSFWHKVEQASPERFAIALGRNPTGRMASADEVATAAVFLASPRSNYTTGANLTVDGALTQMVHF
ncbi:MAG TPA: SDR family oxidoreductase [Phenylobacterium sp.]|uniref:SDR family NAD(P)-dependent oxidoreductase n=1 Tax=Phenylobacterium sp. TaxID=1871053 RepID=UPI002B46369F|nr:SDR family oxidoreductase [Phenylobacterium sp.]HKR90207.1 SDR family oxidoreductase [Phenylobacterium sp.]